MEDTTKTAPPVEGVPGTTPESQVTVPEGQPTEQQQETGQDQVEVSDQQTSSQEETRKPSDYYRERTRYRRKIDSLEATVKQMQEAQQKTVSPPKEEAPVSYDENPDLYLQKMEERVESRVRQQILEVEMPKKEKEMEYNRNEQEGLEILFPKTEKYNHATWRERAEANPDRSEKIQNILEQEGLDELGKLGYPLKAAKLALKIYESETNPVSQRKTNPNAIKKSLMGPTATGSQPTGGTTQMATREQLQAEVKKLDAEVDKNPALRYDDGWRERRKQVQNQYTQLIKEMQK